MGERREGGTKKLCCTAEKERRSLSPNVFSLHNGFYQLPFFLLPNPRRKASSVSGRKSSLRTFVSLSRPLSCLILSFSFLSPLAGGDSDLLFRSSSSCVFCRRSNKCPQPFPVLLHRHLALFLRSGRQQTDVRSIWVAAKVFKKRGAEGGRPYFTLSPHLDLMVSLARYSLNLLRSVRRPASLFGTAFGGGLKRTEQRVRIGEVECGSFPSSFSLFLCILVQREGLREGRASKGRVFGILHPTKKAS